MIMKELNFVTPGVDDLVDDLSLGEGGGGLFLPSNSAFTNLSPIAFLITINGTAFRGRQKVLEDQH